MTHRLQGCGVRRAFLVIAIVVLASGGTLLLTSSYDTRPGGMLGRVSNGPFRCKPPVADLVTPAEAGTSYNSSPERPRRFPLASGALCRPESTIRLGSGAVLVTGSVALLGAALLRLRRTIPCGEQEPTTVP